MSTGCITITRRIRIEVMGCTSRTIGMIHRSCRLEWEQGKISRAWRSRWCVCCCRHLDLLGKCFSSIHPWRSRETSFWHKARSVRKRTTRQERRRNSWAWKNKSPRSRDARPRAEPNKRLDMEVDKDTEPGLCKFAANSTTHWGRFNASGRYLFLQIRDLQ